MMRTSSGFTGCRLTIIVFAFCALILSHQKAGRSEYQHQQNESLTILSMIRIVSSNDPETWMEADRLHQAISAQSPSRCVADLATALIRTRQSRFSEAWKLTQTLANDISSKPHALRLVHAKLSLWLAMESGSSTLAETRFKNLLAIATDDEFPLGERTNACSFLGHVLGMLEDAPNSCIALDVLAQGAKAIESSKAKLMLETYRRSCEESTRWRKKLVQHVEEFEKTSEQEAERIIDELRNQQEQSKADLEMLEESRKDVNAAKKLSEKEFLEYSRMKFALRNDWKLETPGRPIKPKRWNENITIYEEERDPETGEMKKTSYKDHRETESARRWAKEKNAEIDRDFDVKMSRWRAADNARRTNLQMQMNQVLQSLAQTNQRLDELGQKQEEERSDWIDQRQGHGDMVLSYEAARTALKHVTSSRLRPKSVLSPSNFQLLQFEGEGKQLEKGLFSLSAQR
jgi:DNA-directed RNA polymerase subunit F